MIVVGCVGVFLIFGLISYEPKGMSDYLVDMRTGGSGRRWHAAFELSKRLAKHRGSAYPDRAVGSFDEEGEPKASSVDAAFVQSLLELYEKSEHDDPRLRRYLVLCLGYVQGSGVREALLEALSDEDEDLRFYAIWSLAVQRDTESVPRLLEMLGREGPSMRRVIVYALGVLGDARALESLKGHLNDAEVDVRWNAALALARFGDGAGTATLAKMLDRESLRQINGIDEQRMEQVMINAIRASILLQDSALDQVVSELARNETNLKVRQAALKAAEETVR